MELLIIELIIDVIFIITFILFMESVIKDIFGYNPYIRLFIAVIIFCISTFLFYKEIKRQEKDNKFEKIEFVVEKKEKVSNFLYDEYYLKSNKGIILVDKIDYYNFDRGDTLIIKEKELNKSATILDYRKVKYETP